jgi:hypothetical protein
MFSDAISELWAVYTYTVFFVINQIILFVSGLWTPVAFIAPLVIIVIMFAYLSRMH